MSDCIFYLNGQSTCPVGETYGSVSCSTTLRHGQKKLGIEPPTQRLVVESVAVPPEPRQPIGEQLNTVIKSHLHVSVRRKVRSINICLSHLQGWTEHMAGGGRCGWFSMVTVFFTWSWLMSSYICSTVSGCLSYVAPQQLEFRAVCTWACMLLVFLYRSYQKSALKQKNIKFTLLVSLFL